MNKTITISPTGTVPFAVPAVAPINVGITSGAGCVNVAKRVGSFVRIKRAANVGSIVFVTRGVGVPGISTTGRSPRKSTYSAYTHA